MASAASLQSLQQSLGLTLSTEWLAAFASQAGPAFASAPGQRQKQLLFEAFLVADLRQAGAGCLPADLQVSLAASCSASQLSLMFDGLPLSAGLGTGAAWPAATCCRWTRS